MNRNLNKVKERAKHILGKSRSDSGNGKCRGNGVAAGMQYLRNSKELLWLKGGKGKMIMRLERSWRPDDRGPELGGSPRNLCMPSKSPTPTSLSIPTHLYTAGLWTIRINLIMPPCLVMPVPPKCPRSIPWILLPIWLSTSCFLIPSSTSPFTI